MGWRWRGNVETQTRGTVTDSSRSFANRYTIFPRDLPAIREAAFDSSYRKKRDEESEMKKRSGNWIATRFILVVSKVCRS